MPTPDSSAGSAGTAACAPDSRRCGGEGVQRCSDEGDWEDVGACTSEDPVCFDGECVLCNPGQRGCQGNTPRQCAEDGTEWLAEGECSDDAPACLDALGECGVCSEGDLQCDGDTPQSCSSQGRWVDQPACGGDTPVCLVGECVECDPRIAGGIFCDGESVVRICSVDGAWVGEQQCSGDEPICYEGRANCGCRAGEWKCEGARPFLCSSEGLWVGEDACSGETPSCLAETGLCGCEEGARGCSDSGRPRECSEGEWVELDECTGDTPLCTGAGECVCDDESRRCGSDGVPELCASGQWTDQAPCEGITPVCDSETGSCICVDDAPRCDHGAPSSCINGAWVTAEPCPAGTQECRDGVCECVDDALPETTLVRSEAFGCGQAFDYGDDPTGAWVAFDSSVHYDTETGLAWAWFSDRTGQSEANAFCGALTLAGLSDWRLPTITEMRTLAAGCESTAPGGVCSLAEDCLSEICAADCGSCPAGLGPNAGLYLRKNVQVTANTHTASTCDGCSEPSDWIYSVDNGNFVAFEVAWGLRTMCVHGGVADPLE